MRDKNSSRIRIPDDAILDVDVAVDYPIIVHDFAIFNQQPVLRALE